MIIPYGTDAPIYHFPFGTIGITVANVIVYMIQREVGVEGFAPYTLQFGVGFHPIQWLSHMFMHIDFFHLLGNTIFLWGFGIIVEGKVGALIFVPMYVAMGMIEGGIVQAIMWNEQPIPGLDDDVIIPCALGASGAIYGLLAIAMLWAPKNDLNVFVLLFIRFFTLEVSVRFFVGLYLAWELWDLFFWHNFQMSSQLLHVIGACLGLATGTIMLKMHWVDCENWDLFSIMAGTHGNGPVAPTRAPKLREMSASERKGAAKRGGESPSENGDELLAKARKKFAGRIEAGDPLGALEVHEQARKRVEGWNLSAQQLGALIKALNDAGEHMRAVPLMAEYAERSPEHGDRIRLKMAQILLKGERPIQAERILAGIRGPLPPDQQALKSRLLGHAAHLREEGVMELEGD